MTSAAETVTLPGHVVENPRLGSWLDVHDNLVEVHVGKVELGQGILTALAQIAADALELPVEALRMVPAHTAHGPDEGLTAGSLSVLQAGPALRHVGAVVRALAGPVEPRDAYLDRIARLDPGTDLRTVPPAAPGAGDTVIGAVGRSTPRIDLPDKVLGRPRYLADIRPAGLLHGRVVRPPAPGARLDALDPIVLPGLEVVRDGSFVGLVGAREVDVDRGLEALAAACTWTTGHELPDEDDLAAWLRSGEHERVEVRDDQPPAGARSASYSKPFLAHASIAPSAGMALWSGDLIQVWSHSQGIYQLRDAIAAALPVDVARVEVQHVENAGCYGHNAADDAAYDAVLLARAVPGSPVLVRWSRSDELTWSPLSSAMTATLSATLTQGRITAWTHDVWSQGHSTRPGYRGVPGLLAAGHVAEARALPAPTDPLWPPVAG